MVVSTRGEGSGSGSTAGIEPMDERMQGFISSEITLGILEQTLVIFGPIKEGIMEIMQGRQKAHRIGII